MNKPTPAWLQDARGHWTNRGDTRPPFADEPAAGQESVWDYPRPPGVVPDQRAITVGDDAGPIAVADHSIRLLETSHPPSFYLPPESIIEGRLVTVSLSSHCEWKGPAEYLAIAGSEEPIGWRYPTPYEEFAEYAGWVSFYPGRVACTVAGEVVRGQAGGFYGGWVTDEIAGPFKGEPGTSGW